MLESVFEKIGVLATVVLTFWLSKAGYAAFAFFLRGGKKLRDYGEWGVVTGATDGIGKAYAMELARQGLNVLLVSRTEEKLKEVQKEILEKYSKVKVDYLPIDYSNFDADARKKVEQKLESLDVGMLINNVGASYPFTKYFHELSDEDVQGLVELNVNSTVWMTRIVLGDETSKKGMIQRRRGAIVNTSSGAGRGPTPLLSEYSGAKAFIEYFSKGLSEELKGFNIHVQCQAPLFVTTKLAKIRKSSISVPTPTAYARVAAAHIGYEDSVSPYWPHALQLWGLRQLPDWVAGKICMAMHLPIRKSGMKKEALKNTDKKSE